MAWHGARHSLLLAKAGERAIQVRHGVVQVEDKQGGACQIAHPILIGDGLYGVVALELPAQAKESLDIAMRLAQWGVAWFGHLFADKARAGNADKGELAIRFGALTTALAAGRHQPAAEALATFLADRLDCDKVSLGRHRRSQTSLIALSHGGFASVRNTYLTALTAAMDEAADGEGAIRYPMPAADLATPHAAHAALARTHGADWVQSVAVDLDPQGEEQLILVAEGRGKAPDEIGDRLQEFTGDLAPALWLRLRAEQGPVQRLAEITAKAAHARPIWRYAVYAGVAIAALAALLIPLPYRISVDATLETTERRVIAAPYDGYLAEATARPGDSVKAGALLGRFDDRDLKNQRNDVLQHLSETTRELNEAIGIMDRAKANVLMARKAQFEADLALVNDQLRRAELRAPFDAVVVAGDKTQSIGAPMRRGEALYEVSPLGSYRVALEIPQTDFAEIATGQDGQLVLSALPYETLELGITRLTPIALAHDGKTVIRAEADLLNVTDLLRPGMQGVAHIRIGEARAGWLFTHRIIDWLQLKLWVWLP
ncbi:MAG: HlyD family efflux transporter periplasmic adaptor subunit [Pseudolabrys sp.]